MLHSINFHHNHPSPLTAANNNDLKAASTKQATLSVAASTAATKGRVSILALQVLVGGFYGWVL